MIQALPSEHYGILTAYGRIPGVPGYSGHPDRESHFETIWTPTSLTIETPGRRDLFQNLLRFNNFGYLLLTSRDSQMYRFSKYNKTFGNQTFYRILISTTWRLISRKIFYNPRTLLTQTPVTELITLHNAWTPQWPEFKGIEGFECPCKPTIKTLEL